MKIDSTKRICEGITQLHTQSPETIGDLFRFQLLSDQEGTGEYCFRCETASWMQNVYGTLHGGISASILDQAMGLVVYGILPPDTIAPTLQMQQVYHRPFSPGSAARVIVKVTAKSGSLIHMSAELYDEAALDKLCVSATAIYYHKIF